MSATRASLALVLCLLVGLVGCTTASGSDGSTEELQKQIQALTSRINSLEQQVASLKAGGAQAPNQALEAEAQTAYRAIQGLIGKGEVDEAKKQLADFSKKYGATRTGRQAQRTIEELSVVGKSRPADWGIQKWFQGEKEVDLNSNKATVVVFWETWCPHCRREVPKLQAMYKNYKDKGLQVLGVTKVTKSSTDEGVAEFIEQQKLSYPIAKENGTLSTHFGVRGIPAAAVLKNGKVVWRGHPVSITDDMLKAWL